MLDKLEYLNSNLALSLQYNNRFKIKLAWLIASIIIIRVVFKFLIMVEKYEIITIIRAKRKPNFKLAFGKIFFENAGDFGKNVMA